MKKLLATTALTLALMTGSAAYAGPGGEGPKGPPPHLKEALAKLPAEKAKLVEDSFKAGHETRKADHDKLKAIHEEIKGIVEAPKFDKSAFLAKLGEAHKIEDLHRADRDERMADVNSKLTQEERKVLAEAMPKHRKHGPRPPRPEGDGPDGGPDGKPE